MAWKMINSDWDWSSISEAGKVIIGDSTKDTLVIISITCCDICFRPSNGIWKINRGVLEEGCFQEPLSKHSLDKTNKQ